ncbi:MAG: phosphatidate cytidylyltransferase [Chitinophagales bacterium]|nr:phosphatidate cytidylyltransferase [Chitinophagales bacterium]MDW8427169.1 phosphatidate cytidylyltransferase [Chitinophagales bacterium]
MKELPLRVKTAAVLASLVLASVLAHRLSFYLLVAAVQAVCLWEYFGLIEKFLNYKDALRRRVRMLTVALATAWHLSIWFAADVADYYTLWLAFPLLLVVLTMAELLLTQRVSMKNLGLFFAGLICISGTLSHCYLISLPATEEWRPWPALLVLAVVLLIWATDTAAYFCGKFWGKHRLAPLISPNKTWEGLVGGLVGAVATALLLAEFMQRHPIHFWIGLAVVVAVSSVMGDLGESWLKRKAGVKDAGRLLPGHGGMLDRFDGWLTAMPASAYWMLTSSA